MEVAGSVLPGAGRVEGCGALVDVPDAAVAVVFVAEVVFVADVRPAVDAVGDSAVDGSVGVTIDDAVGDVDELVTGALPPLGSAVSVEFVSAVLDCAGLSTAEVVPAVDGPIA